jgi:acyl-CoA synthetase (NDP forming)
MEKSVDLVLGSNSYDAVLVFLGITGAAPSMAVPLRDALAAAYSRHPDRLLVLCVTASGDLLRSYDAQGMFVFEDPARAITALAALAHFADSFAAAAEAVPPALAPPGVTLPPARALNEAEAKQLLERCGVRVPRERRVDTPDEAAVAAAEIGLPVALKIVSRDILHKTDAGGVLLGLAPAEAVRDGARRMATSVAAAVPGARLEGFLVSEMVPAGIECLVGVRRDAVFGPLLTVALGGTLVELYRDAARRLAPVTPAIARGMLEELVSYRLLTG